MDSIIRLLWGIITLFVGLFFGRRAERRHFEQLARDEAELATMFVTEMKIFPGGVAAGSRTQMVVGEVAVSSDAYKTFIAAIRKIFGGRLSTYETLMERARREAIVRMLKDARRQGFDSVCNVRLESVDMGGVNTAAQGGLQMAAILASGTAYKRTMAPA